MTVAARRRSARRELPVRRWLQLGAASAGVGAALLGWSLVGDQVGVAAAETSDGASASAGAAESAGEHTTASTSAASDASNEADTAKSDTDESEKSAEHRTARNDDSSEVDADDHADAAADLTGKKHTARASATTPAKTEPTGDDTESDEPSVEEGVDSTAEHSTAAPEKAAVTSAAATTKKATAPTLTKPVTRQQTVAWQIRDGFAAGQAAINHLPVDPAVRNLLTATLTATRRTFYNQAPHVSPVQVTGKLDGPVTGTLGAIDPDGDRIVYRLTGKPKTGTVRINPDGTYTYTPGAGFTGVDTFTVTVSDPGLHVNLLDPFRPAGTRAGNVVNQRAIRFDFSYGSGAQYWTPQARDALQTAADAMVAYFTVTAPVVLTFDVTGESDTVTARLASAGSELISEDDGFHPTVVQHKIITGIDANGAAADGVINWNFGQPWAYGDVVGEDEFDFQTTAVHEIMHALGFAATLDPPGSNTVTEWSTFDGYIVTASGARVVDPEDYTFVTAYDPKLTGPVGDGLFFGGPEAVAAYGGLVPLFTAATWISGSSAAHLDDRVFTGSNAKVMNAFTDTGRGVRVLSPVELGILRDLGYTVGPLPTAPAPTAALALVGLVFLRRPKKR